MLRLVRVPSHSLRVFRSVKLGMLVRTLRLILLALMKSLVPFLWALLILLLTIFMFAIVFVNGVAGHVQEGEGERERLARTSSVKLSMSRNVTLQFA